LVGPVQTHPGCDLGLGVENRSHQWDLLFLAPSTRGPRAGVALIAESSQDDI
jgi:hypothetical protein